jgi:DMSO/TMAO reductase YedYZ molybdopterin-dependent catalytic subunit
MIMRSVAVLMCAAVLAASCSTGNQSGLAELAKAEVRDYQGEHLGSILDFRENSIKGPQHVDIADYRLNVTGLVAEPEAYTYEQVLGFPHYSKVVTIHCVEGWSVKILWEGVLVEDILNASGVEPGANTVIFHSYDGYTTSLPLDYVLDHDLIVAYNMNGLRLPPERGFPFQLVAEAKLGYKWAKWITQIELSDDPTYRGFWESRGYPTDADVGWR